MIDPESMTDAQLLQADVELQRRSIEIAGERRAISDERARRIGRVASNVIPFPRRGVFAEGGDAS